MYRCLLSKKLPEMEQTPQIALKAAFDVPMLTPGIRGLEKHLCYEVL